MEQRSRFTIRTSDRRVFRRCLRKWEFQSSLRGNWKHQGTEQNINFWFGSAIHFAMEDYHGYNRFGDPRIAFWAYYQSFPSAEMPMAADAHYELGMAMLSYYMTWYPRHNDVAGFETVWVDPETHTIVPKDTPNAEPGVEQSFILPLNVWAACDIHTEEIIETYDDNASVPFLEQGQTEFMLNGHTCHLVPICYHGTMDRIVVDRYGRYWILDYKTAKGADTNKLDTDDQIGRAHV